MDWSSEIKKGRPSNWSLPVEVSVEWKEPEKKRLVGALKQLPAKMQTVPIVGLFRMKKSVQLFNPASVADGKLVFYDSAFDGPFSFDQVVAHEVAHVLYEKMGPALRKSYETTLKWGQGLQPRPGQFVDQNGKESTEEDFATNVEFYLFKKEKLDATTPLASKWIEEKFGKDFKLSPDCEREDK